MSQKDIFLASEGDAWLARNGGARDYARDPVLAKVVELEPGRSLTVLEIGCGDGSRLQYLAKVRGHEVHGIDPSAAAVARAVEKGVHALQATADRLPFEAARFDLVIFGFCLYLWDVVDLFRIAQEADRVLRASGWLVIHDFYARAPRYRDYHHYAGVQSRKMDYKAMFTWHPSYTLASEEITHHVSGAWSDDPDEWTSLACLRKHSRGDE